MKSLIVILSLVLILAGCKKNVTEIIEEKYYELPSVVGDIIAANDSGWFAEDYRIIQNGGDEIYNENTFFTNGTFTEAKMEYEREGEDQNNNNIFGEGFIQTYAEEGEYHWDSQNYLLTKTYLRKRNSNGDTSHYYLVHKSNVVFCENAAFYGFLNESDSTFRYNIAKAEYHQNTYQNGQQYKYTEYHQWKIDKTARRLVWLRHQNRVNMSDELVWGLQTRYTYEIVFAFPEVGYLAPGKESTIHLRYELYEQRNQTTSGWDAWQDLTSPTLTQNLEVFQMYNYNDEFLIVGEYYLRQR